MKLERIKNQSGFLLVDKPSGPTSHDIINQLRKISGIRKIGHAGTLDPFASGLLIVAVGREATKQISRFVKMDKEYIATLFLGAATDTHDLTGKLIKAPSAIQAPETEKISLILKSFSGKQEQIPPMYSAKKIKGKKLYQLARQGIEIEREPAMIEIFEIKLLSYQWPELKLKIKCSSGTYIRSLAHDAGQALGCGAYLKKLVRSGINGYLLEEALKINEINKNNFFASLKSL